MKITLIPFLLTFGAAITYSLSVIFTKRSIASGLGPWRMTFISNTVMSLCFLPIFFFSDTPWDNAVLPGAILGGFTFFIGQIFVFLSLTHGDVSLATPILSIKVIFVATLTVLILNQPIGWTLWVACLLTVIGIMLIQGIGMIKLRHLDWKTVALASASAFSFAITDIVFQESAGNFDFQLLLPTLFTITALFSFILIPFFHAPLWSLSKTTVKFIIPSSLLIALQALMLSAGIALSQHAAVANIIYSSRGIFTIIFVWLIGHWFGNHEKHIGATLMKKRLAGSFLILLAIALTFI